MLVSRCKNFLRALTFYCFTNAFITHLPLYRLRHWYLRSFLGVRIGRGSAVHMGCLLLDKKRNRHRRRHGYQRNAYLDGRGKLTIGDHVPISPETIFWSLDHDPQSKNSTLFRAPFAYRISRGSGAGNDFVVGYVHKGAVMPGCARCHEGRGRLYHRLGAYLPNPIRQRSADIFYSPRYFPYFNTDIQP